MGRNLCFVVTDAISFNVLYNGQLEHLAGHAFKLTLICGGSADELDRLRARNVGAVIDMKFVRAPSAWIDFVSLMRLIWHFVFNRYDLVMVTTPKALLLGSIAACVTVQKRRVAFFQGRVYENYRGLRRRAYRMFDRVTIFCVHEVLFVSRSLMSEFVDEIPAAESKSQVLGDGSANGVCARTFSREVAASHVNSMKNDVGLSVDDFVVLVVGRICNDKGLKEIVDVAQRFAGSRVKLLLLGRPEGEAAEIQLSHLVAARIVRHVPFSSNVAGYFALADAHLFLSHREGFGNVAIEAAAMGVPTIAFDVVGVRDSVNTDVSGLRVPFGDVDAVVAAIRDLVEDSDKMQSRFASARQWAIRKFARERVWALYERFYSGIQ